MAYSSTFTMPIRNVITNRHIVFFIGLAFLGSLSGAFFLELPFYLYVRDQMPSHYMQGKLTVQDWAFESVKCDKLEWTAQDCPRHFIVCPKQCTRGYIVGQFQSDDFPSSYTDCRIPVGKQQSSKENSWMQLNKDYPIDSRHTAYIEKHNSSSSSSSCRLSIDDAHDLNLWFGRFFLAFYTCLLGISVLVGKQVFDGYDQLQQEYDCLLHVQQQHQQPTLSRNHKANNRHKKQHNIATRNKRKLVDRAIDHLDDELDQPKPPKIKKFDRAMDHIHDDDNSYRQKNKQNKNRQNKQTKWHVKVRACETLQPIKSNLPVKQSVETIQSVETKQPVKPIVQVETIPSVRPIIIETKIDMQMDQSIEQPIEPSIEQRIVETVNQYIGQTIEEESIDQSSDQTIEQPTVPPKCTYAMDNQFAKILHTLKERRQEMMKNVDPDFVYIH